MDLWTYSKLFWVSASPFTFILILCLYPNAQSEICPNGKAFVKWFTGVTVLWGCYKTVKHEVSTLFYYPRALPSPKLLPCRQGLWEMRVPLNQPSLARKRQVLHVAGGSVRGRSGGGEPHTPDQASSLRFSCSLCGSQPQGTWRPQVSKHTQNRLSMLLRCCLNSYLFIGVLIYAPQHVHLISVKKQNHASLLIEVLVKGI